MKSSLQSKRTPWWSLAKIETFLFRFWARRSFFSDLLLPLSWVYGCIQSRFATNSQAQRIKVDIPVIAVGNLTVGGTGKTPFCIWLGLALKAQGLRPAYVVRAFKARATAPTQVLPHSSPLDVGDEAMLLWQRTSLPVFSGRYKWQAAQMAARGPFDVLIVDDGLQHYRLHHDVAILLVDGEYGFGNGRLLPAGPLREPIQKVDVDIKVLVGSNTGSNFTMQVKPAFFYRLHEPQQRKSLDSFKEEKILAVAGIARPERFFKTLANLGLQFEKMAFPDHHTFRPKDLLFDGIVMMTEKDAVKCRDFGLKNIWVLAIDAEVKENLISVILERLHGPKTSGPTRLPHL